jgi:hypothetical protein
MEILRSWVFVVRCELPPLHLVCISNEPDPLCSVDTHIRGPYVGLSTSILKCSDDIVGEVALLGPP